MENLFDRVSKDKIELLKQAQEERRRVLVGTLRPKKNHILFEFDLIKGVVKRAEFHQPQEISFLDAKEGLPKQKKEVNGREGCYYISAMNLENAWKKFNKL